MSHCTRTCEMNHYGNNSSIGNGEPVLHICSCQHACSHPCSSQGFCDITTNPSISTAMKQEGVKNQCNIIIPPFQREHSGEHSCGKSKHYCTTKCPCCFIICNLEYGHDGLHDVKQHGPMINSYFITNAGASIKEVEIQYFHPKSNQQRSMKFFENQDGTKFTCDMYCRVLGRGHTHLIQCSHKHPTYSNSNTNGTEQNNNHVDDGSCPYDGELSLVAMGRRHSMTMSNPSRGRLVDELRHDKFWELCGFVDPSIGKAFVTEELVKSFNLCRVSSNHKRSNCIAINPLESLGHDENYCTRHVNHDLLDIFSPEYLEQVSLLAERFPYGGLSPSGHHFAYSYAYHHYVLIDCSKYMTQEDIIPSLKHFAPSAATTVSSATPEEFVKFYNRMGYSAEIALRYLHIRYKLNAQDKFTLIAFNRKSTQVLIEDESTQYYYASMDLMLSNAKPSDKIGYKNGFEKLLELLEKHSESNTRLKLQPKVLLISGGKIEGKKKSTSVSGVPKWHSLRLKKGDSLKSVHGKAEQFLLKIIAHLTKQHNTLYGNQYFSPQESVHFTVVKVGVEGNDYRLKQFLVLGREAMTMIDSGLMHQQIENDHTMEMNREYIITIEQENGKKDKNTFGLPQIASKLVVRVIGELLLPFEQQCQLNENIKNKNGGLLVKTQMHQVDERKQQNLTEKQLKALAERDNLAREILETERTYVTCLSKLIELYYYPLSKYLTHAMTDNDRNKIFSGLLNIYKLHKTLIVALEERLSHWNDRQKIGDIFVELSPTFMLYTQFTTKYETAIETFNQQSKNLLGNILYLRRKDPYTHHHTLNSFLIMPIQRIPRYKLLLEGVLKYTEESHPDYTNLCNAVAEMEKIADYLNSKITERQNFHKMKLISQKVIGVRDLIQPNRKYIGEFSIKHRVNSTTQEDCILILFNDLVLHCVQKEELTPKTKGRSRSFMGRSSKSSLSKSRSFNNLSDNGNMEGEDGDIIGVLEDDKSGITYEAKYAFVLTYLQVHPLSFSQSGGGSRMQIQYNHPSTPPQTLEYVMPNEEEKTRIVTQLNEAIAEAVKRNHAGQYM